MQTGVERELITVVKVGPRLLALLFQSEGQPPSDWILKTALYGAVAVF